MPSRGRGFLLSLFAIAYAPFASYIHAAPVAAPSQASVVVENNGAAYAAQPLHISSTEISPPPPGTITIKAPADGAALALRWPAERNVPCNLELRGFRAAGAGPRPPCPRA